MIVYRVKNKLDGKMYIGQTIKTLERRWYAHCREESDCRYLKSAIKKYGKDSFEVSVLARCNSLEEMNHREAYYIKLFKSIAPNGYNLTTGGDRHQMSEETKKIISKNSKKMWAEGKGCSYKGHKHSEASKLKTAAALTGKKHTDERKKNQSLAKIGKPLSEKHKAALKLSNKPNSGTFGHGRSAPNKGRKRIMVDGKIKYV